MFVILENLSVLELALSGEKGLVVPFSLYLFTYRKTDDGKSLYEHQRFDVIYAFVTKHTSEKQSIY